ncbi:MAG TPA: hypothetical protein VK255_01505 [Patescibacteria group bacterium]|nr:hypothetical protein [Patescibacteria group bacterium]
MPDKKIIYIPGWLDQGKNFPQYETLEIWKENISPDFETDCDIIIAHSLGCHFSILNWQRIRDKKIIFVNPLVANRNVFSWFWRWLKFRANERHGDGWKYVTKPSKIFRAIYYFFKLLWPDLFSKINNDAGNIVVIRGRRDYYFCDENSCRVLREKSIEIIELDEVGHLWNEKIDEEIKKIVVE